MPKIEPFESFSEAYDAWFEEKASCKQKNLCTPRAFPRAINQFVLQLFSLTSYLLSFFQCLRYLHGGVINPFF